MNLLTPASDLSSLLDFIDRLAVDDKLYWRFTAQSGGVVELAWHRDAAPKSWSLTCQGASHPAIHDAASLLTALMAIDLDAAQVERQIGATILMQAVYADLVVQGAVQLFGAEAVEMSKEGMRQFLGNVQATAENLTKPTPKLRVLT